MISKAIRCCGLGLSIALSGCVSAPWTTPEDLGLLKDEITKQREENQALYGKMDQLAEQQQALLEAYQEHEAKLDAASAPVNTFTISESTPVAAPVNADLRDAQETAPAAIENTKLVVGRKEKIYFPALEITFEGRIDTGAESSSMDARDIKRFERDGSKWVRFTVYRGDTEVKTLERPVVRWVRVFQSTDIDGDRRPVVQLAFKMGDVEDVADFTLTDRAHLDYSVLVGRNILTDLMVVDVSKSFLLGNN